MTVQTTRGGFTLLEMLVASLLLSMLVVALSMVFSSSASAWRIGSAGVRGLHSMRQRMSEYQLSSDNALPNLKGKGSAPGYVRAVWLNGSSLVDTDGETVDKVRGFETTDIYEGRSGIDTTKPFKSNLSVGSASGNQVKNYTVGAGSAGPDRVWGTKDDIATWPNEPGGGI